MAFFASLIAYVGTVAGIVAAFLVGLSTLLATPEQSSTPPVAAATAHRAMAARATPVGAVGPGDAKLQAAKPDHLARERVLTRERVGKGHILTARTATGRNWVQDAGRPYPASPGMLPHGGQWASQQEAMTAHRVVGEAERPDGSFDRTW